MGVGVRVRLFVCGTLVSQCLCEMCWESLYYVVPANVSQHGSHVWYWFVTQPVDHDIHDQ
jgi:hypothetical protein